MTVLLPVELYSPGEHAATTYVPLVADLHGEMTLLVPLEVILPWTHTEVMYWPLDAVAQGE